MGTMYGWLLRANDRRAVFVPASSARHSCSVISRITICESFLSRSGHVVHGGQHRRDRRHWGPRQIDGEHAPPTGHVGRIESPAIGLGTPSAEGEPDAQAAAIGTPLLERGYQLLLSTVSWKPAAFVVDLDQDALRAATNAQCHGAVRPCELERVLQEIPDYRREDSSIGVNRHSALHRGHD